MMNEKTGFFLTKLDESNPYKYQFLTLYSQKLTIGDANMFISRGQDLVRGPFKELIVGYKSIYINTYNVVVNDLSNSSSALTRCTMHRHECF